MEQWQKDEFYMRRCLQLAQMAEGHTSPNPMVGAVIVCDDKIIGEGYHHKAGQPHAEPMAINSVKDESLLSKSTLYVSLEPCSHWGKTPPCADLIVQKGFKRVVAAMLDPNPLVAGKGFDLISKAGIRVDCHVLEKEARFLNRRFLTFFEKKRPYVILKWAQTADEFIDIERDSTQVPPLRISNEITKTLNHQLRVQEDAVMVATNTALKDNPHLTVTKWSGKNPLRVLLDLNGRVPADYKILDSSAKTLVFTTLTGLAEHISGRAKLFGDNLPKENITFSIAINSLANAKGGYQLSEDDNVEFFIVKPERDLYEQVLQALYQRGIQSIIIEGGSKWLSTVIQSGIWDEARIEVAPIKVYKGVKAPAFQGTLGSVEQFQENHIFHYYNSDEQGV